MPLRKQAAAGDQAPHNPRNDQSGEIEARPHRATAPVANEEYLSEQVEQQDGHVGDTEQHAQIVGGAT